MDEFITTEGKNISEIKTLALMSVTCLRFKAVTKTNRKCSFPDNYMFHAKHKALDNHFFQMSKAHHMRISGDYKCQEIRRNF